MIPIPTTWRQFEIYWSQLSLVCQLRMGLDFIFHDKILIQSTTPVLLGVKGKSNVSWLGKVFETVERLCRAPLLKPIGFFPMDQAQYTCL